MEDRIFYLYKMIYDNNVMWLIKRRNKIVCIFIFIKIYNFDIFEIFFIWSRSG